MAQGALAPCVGIFLNAALVRLFTWDGRLVLLIANAEPRARAGFSFASLPDWAPVSAGLL
jgi:hypothetical protein